MTRDFRVENSRVFRRRLPSVEPRIGLPQTIALKIPLQSAGDDVADILFRQAMLPRPGDDLFEILDAWPAETRRPCRSDDVCKGSQFLAMQVGHHDRLALISAFVAVQFLEVRWNTAIDDAENSITRREDISERGSRALEMLKDQTMIRETNNPGTMLSKADRAGSLDHLIEREITAVGKVPRLHESAVFKLPCPKNLEVRQSSINFGLTWRRRRRSRP